MRTVDAAFKNAIEGPERVVRAILTVDFEGNGHQQNALNDVGYLDDLSGMVDTLQCEQAIQGDLPQEVKVVRGSAVAALSATLNKGTPVAARPVVTYRAAASAVNGASGVTGLTVSTSGVNVGDFMVLFVTVADDNAYATCGVFATSSGPGPIDIERWTPIAFAEDGTVGSMIRTTVFAKYKRADEGDAGITFRLGSGTAEDFVTASASAALVAYGATVAGKPGMLGPHKFDAVAYGGGSTTTHTTPAITTTLQRAVLISCFSRRVTAAAGTWTPQSGDTERVDVVGGHASLNVAMAVMTTDAEVGPGTYSKQATASGASADVTTAIVALGIPDAGDDRQHPTWLWSASNEASPYRNLPRQRRPVRCDLEMLTSTGPQRVNVFQGYTRDLGPSVRSRSVSLTALDLRELFRLKVTLPPIWGDTTGLNATWLVSSICAEAGLHPAPRDTTWEQLYISMHGSLYPQPAFNELGESIATYTAVDTLQYVNGSGTVMRPVFVAGPYVLGAYAEITSSTVYKRIDLTLTASTPLGAVTLFPGSANGRVEWEMRGDSFPAGTTQNEAFYYRTQVDDPNNRFLYVGVWKDRKLFARFDNNGVDTFLVFGPTLPTDGNWHFCGVHWDFDSGTQKIYWNLDGAETNTTVTVNTAFLTGNRFDPDVARSYLPIAELTVRNAPVPASFDWNDGTGFTSDCDLDMSELELKASMDGRERESWEVLREIGDAENAVIYFEDGVFRYRTRARLSADNAATVQRTVTSYAAISDIDLRESIDTVRNVITVPYTPVVRVGTSLEYLTQQLSVGLELLDGSSVSYDVTFGSPANGVDMSFDNLTAAPGSPSSYAIFNTLQDGTGTDVTAGVSASGIVWTASGLRIGFSNTSGLTLYLKELGVAGLLFKLGDSTESVTNFTSAGASSETFYKWGDQPLDVSSSQWIQDVATAQKLGEALFWELSAPQSIITKMRIRGDPRLILNDRIRIQDLAGAALDDDYWITGFRWSLDSSGYWMDLDCRRASDVAEWDTARWDYAINEINNLQLWG